MADQQPGDQTPAAGMPDPTRLDPGGDSSTLDAPVRWSGSAAVPPPAPKKSRWARRRAEAGHDEPAPEPTAVDPEDWAATPPVDPWADQATPWDAFPLPPAAALPPTRPEPALPPTRQEGPVPPAPQPPAPAPTLAPAPQPPAPQPAAPQPPAPQPPAQQPAPQPPAQQPAPQPAAQQPAAQQPASQPAATARPPVPLPPRATGRRGRRGRKARQAAAPVNRVPGQPRPPAAPTVGGRPLPAPPPWTPRQPQRPLPAPPRRKRRWGRRMALLGLLGVVCCCGVPVAYLQFPAARQYPVSAALPQSFADLRLRDDGTSKQAADRLARQLRDADANADDVFAGVYGDGNGKRVTVFGVTGWRFTPGRDVQAQLDRLSDEFDVSDVQTYDPGESGVYERCGVGRTGGAAVVVCTWADHGSLATVLLTRRSIADSADLVARLRSAVLTPG
jgi:hypothetical protein